MNKNYPIYKTTFIDDMRSLVEEAAQNFSDSIAISYKENYWDKEVRKVTFTQWRDDVRNLGTALVADGLREENIAIVGENSYGWCCSFFAVMAIGSVTVPVDKELPTEDIDGIVTTTGCKALIFGKTAEPKVKELLKQGGLKSVELLVSVAPESSLEAAELGGRTLTTLEKLQNKGAQLYKDGDNSYYDYKIDVNKLASIVFTSGTTGKGKGVMLSQANIGLDMTLGMYNFDITRKTLHVLPPHHTFGSTVNYVGHLSQGCEVYISSGLKHVSDEIREQQPTHLILVPAFLEVMNRKIWTTARKTGKEGLLKMMMKFSDGLRKIGIDLRKKLFSSVLAAFGGKLELVICGGDWMGNSDTKEQAIAKLTYIKSYMGKLFGGKALMVLGNHDTNYQGEVQLSRDEVNELWFKDTNTGKAYYYVDTDTARFIVLDTQTDWAAGWSDYFLEQYNWLAANLSEDKLNVVVPHIIWVDSERTTRTALADVVRVMGGVSLVLGGHLHEDYVENGDVPEVLTTDMRAGGTPTFDLCALNNTKLTMLRVGSGKNRTIDLGGA